MYLGGQPARSPLEVHVQQEDAAVWKTVVLSGLMCLMALPALAAEPAPKKVEMKRTLSAPVLSTETRKPPSSTC